MTSPNLDRFYKEFWHDYEKGELKPVEEYVPRYPDHETEIREVRFYEGVPEFGVIPLATGLERLRALVARAVGKDLPSQLANGCLLVGEGKIHG